MPMYQPIPDKKFQRLKDQTQNLWGWYYYILSPSIDYHCKCESMPVILNLPI